MRQGRNATAKIVRHRVMDTSYHTIGESNRRASCVSSNGQNANGHDETEAIEVQEVALPASLLAV